MSRVKLLRTFGALVFLVVLITPVIFPTKRIKVLILGNSQIFLPPYGKPDKPQLIQMLRRMVAPLDPHVRLIFQHNTQSGYSFEKHLQDKKSLSLAGQQYDFVILQGHTMEALELPAWWRTQRLGIDYSINSFDRLIDLLQRNQNQIYVLVNPGWHSQHEFFKNDHPGLYFEETHSRRGERWSGRDSLEYQKLIEEGYRKLVSEKSVQSLDVGRCWLALQQAGLVSADELYLKNDWRHPSLLGAFITSLVIVRDVFKLPVEINIYFPEGLDPERGRKIQEFLAKQSCSVF